MKKIISSLGILLFAFSTALWAGGHASADGDGVKDHVDHVHDKVDGDNDTPLDATQKEQADMEKAKTDMSSDSE